MASEAEGSGDLLGAVGSTGEEQLVHLFVSHFQCIDIGFNAQFIHVGGVLRFAVFYEVGYGSRFAIELHACGDSIVRQVCP